MWIEQVLDYGTVVVELLPERIGEVPLKDGTGHNGHYAVGRILQLGQNVGIQMSPQDELSEEEAARRRDEVIKRMLATPPQPHKPKKGREPKPAPKKD